MLICSRLSLWCEVKSLTVTLPRFPLPSLVSLFKMLFSLLLLHALFVKATFNADASRLTSFLTDPYVGEKLSRQEVLDLSRDTTLYEWATQNAMKPMVIDKVPIHILSLSFSLFLSFFLFLVLSTQSMTMLKIELGDQTALRLFPLPCPCGTLCPS